jgi:cytochrome P450
MAHHGAPRQAERQRWNFSAHNGPVPFPLPPSPSLYHPTPLLSELRDTRPVAPVVMPDGKRAWLVTRYEDVRQVLVDRRFSRAAAQTPGVARSQRGLAMAAEDSMLGMDPPEHTRLRRLVSRAFTPRRVEELRPRVAALVDELIDGMQRRPRPVDLVENFSLPLPVRVICELLGVPARDRRRFREWSDRVMSDSTVPPEEIEAAISALSDYFAQLIAAKRAAPADDLMTALIQARDDHDRLSEQELVRMCFGLLIAGHETTANQINMFLLTLLHHPNELVRLRANLDGMPRAVEELLRFVQLGDGGTGMPRVTLEEVQLSGVTIPAGEAVLPGITIACRDPDVFTRPDRLDLSREDNPHLAFGAGAHYCLGAQLARMELQEALRGLLRRMPNLRIAVHDSALRFKRGMLLRSLESLPVTW